MAPIASHRQKRQFQPSITTFFARVDREEYEQQQVARVPQQPVLEPSVQSDLLNVGMRIRKAVPEGYKTHKTSLFYDPTPALPSAMHSCPPSYVQHRIPRSSELLPFCGLNKIGGLGVQNMATPVDAQGVIDIFSDNSMPFTSSQESNASTFSTDSMPAAPMLTPLMKNKRRFVLEDEEEDEDIPPFHLHFSDPLDPLLADLSVSSASHPLSHANMSNLNARTIAKPRSRRKGGITHPAGEPIAESMDFEDADFLLPCEDEVSMGGM